MVFAVSETFSLRVLTEGDPPWILCAFLISEQTVAGPTGFIKSSYELVDVHCFEN